MSGPAHNNNGAEHIIGAMLEAAAIVNRFRSGAGRTGVLITLVSVTFQLAPAGLRQLLRFQRDFAEQSEFWRILTGHWVHLGWTHLAMNVIALWLILAVFPRPRFGWEMAWVFCALGCTAGLMIFEPAVGWYVGLSGSLHGLAVVGLVASGFSRVNIAALILIAAKLIFEQWAGGSSVSAGLIGGPVAVDAHLWGAAAGVIWAGLIHSQRQPPRYNSSNQQGKSA